MRRQSNAVAVAAVSAGVKAPRSKISATMGVASAIRPMVAGTLSISISRMPLDSVRRMAGKSPRAASADNVGSDAAATETPNSPIGRYISLNEKLSHDTAPVPWLVASSVFTNWLIWTAASPRCSAPSAAAPRGRAGRVARART